MITIYYEGENQDILGGCGAGGYVTDLSCDADTASGAERLVIDFFSAPVRVDFLDRTPEGWRATVVDAPR